MAANRRKSASKVREIWLESSDDSLVVDSKSELESSLSDFEISDDEESAGTVIYDVRSDFAWCDRQCSQPTRLDITGSPGRKTPILDISDVFHYVRLFLTGPMLEMIVVETVSDRRAQELLQGILKPKSKLLTWIDIDEKELLVFIALLIYQEIFPKPEVEMYWSTKPRVESPFVRSMTERRFGLLFKYLHFVNNGTLPDSFSHPGEKSSAKNREVFASVITQFSTVYIPEQNIAIDESLMLWNAMEQYIPIKKAQFGIKSYELCESGSGYIWNSIVHTS